MERVVQLVVPNYARWMLATHVEVHEMDKLAFLGGRDRL